MSLIFEETKTLTPNDTKTNVPLQFYVAEELEKMKIEFCRMVVYLIFPFSRTLSLDKSHSVKFLSV